MDSAAEVLSEILLSSGPAKLVYHLENPIRQSWHDALVAIAPKLNIPKAGFIPFDSWLDKVRAFHDDPNDAAPAKKLADFFQIEFKHMACGSIILDTKHTRDISPTLRSSGEVNRELLQLYIHHWRSIGYVD